MPTTLTELATAISTCRIMAAELTETTKLHAHTVGFGSGINVTLGMPIIRTSVDHGTALSLAGTGKIEVGSLRAAIDLALELAATPEAPL